MSTSTAAPADAAPRFSRPTGSLDLVSPIVAMAATPTGGGYWLVASDGGIFTFGDATFHGSAADAGLDSPIEAIIPSAAGAGYLLITVDGQILAYGDAELPSSGVAPRDGERIVDALPG